MRAAHPTLRLVLGAAGTAAAVFTVLLVAFTVVPLVAGMTQAPGAGGTERLSLLGLDVFTVTTDGTGGFESTFGHGFLGVPALAAAVVLVLVVVVGVLRRRAVTT